MKLGLKLLQERAKVGSFWWPYISNLPETYSVPIFFPGEDIKNLQYAPLLHQVCHFSSLKDNIYNVLKPKLLKGCVCSWKILSQNPIFHQFSSSVPWLCFCLLFLLVLFSYMHTYSTFHELFRMCQVPMLNIKEMVCVETCTEKYGKERATKLIQS
jgi:hypothetical protein